MPSKKQRENESAYAKMMADNRKKRAEMRKKDGANRQRAKVGGVTCGQRKKTGGHCKMAAGWGTEHPGIGRCKMHGGNSIQNVKAAASEEYRTLLGVQMEINPLDAILWCIKIRAGEVKWLSDRMAELDEKSWIEDTLIGKQFHLYARERQHAMADLARFSQTAISLGIAERAVKLAETYAEMLANYTQGILADLWPYLSPEGKAIAHQSVRRHLLVLDGGKLDDHPVVEQPALPEAVSA